ncbi:MAG: DUF4394 domain-containing protein [Alphaproteobacteria bacterium]|nr:DUF4394 domain-containing protein [Alphaproteobacteria bacterium]
MTRRTMTTMVMAALMATTSLAAQAHMMAGIDNVGNLVRFSDRRPHVVETFPITGTSARIVGIDVRQRDNQLYGLASDGTIYVIDSTSGRATFRARLSQGFDRVGVVDFDPDDDRLYVLTEDGRAVRVNIDTGEVVELMSGSPAMFGPRNLSAGGFTATRFFAVDSTQMVLFHQPASSEAPMSTMRRDISLTGGTEDLRGGDVYTDPNGNQAMYIVRGSRLFKIDLSTGQIILLGQVGTVESLRLIDVAVTQPE